MLINKESGLSGFSVFMHEIGHAFYDSNIKGQDANRKREPFNYGGIMAKLNNRNRTAEQYCNTKNLAIRRAFHEKYSGSAGEFDRWVYNLLQIEAHDVVLEVGSGTGDLWENRLTEGSFKHLVVSDLSDAMIEELMIKMGGRSDITVKKMDICRLQFPDEVFTKVIANSMLYHVKEISVAVSQVYRVLKKEGKFFVTTTSNNGLYSFLCDTLNEYCPNILDPSEITFSLENGEKYLSMFSDVKKVIVKKEMIVTQVEDIVEYIYSMNNIIDLCRIDKNELMAYYKKICNSKGEIMIPKCYGMFICTK